jgi:hypothetical protein
VLLHKASNGASVALLLTGSSWAGLRGHLLLENLVRRARASANCSVKKFSTTSVTEWFGEQHKRECWGGWIAGPGQRGPVTPAWEGKRVGKRKGIQFSKLLLN